MNTWASLVGALFSLLSPLLRKVEREKRRRLIKEEVKNVTVCEKYRGISSSSSSSSSFLSLLLKDEDSTKFYFFFFPLLFLFREREREREVRSRAFQPAHDSGLRVRYDKEALPPQKILSQSLPRDSCCCCPFDSQSPLKKEAAQLTTILLVVRLLLLFLLRPTVSLQRSIGHSRHVRRDPSSSRSSSICTTKEC